MHRRIVSGMLVTLLLVSIVASFSIRPSKASGSVYIRADGSVDPPEAPIQRNGDFYTLTGDISSDADGIVIERDNITFDGAGYTVRGAGSGIGIQMYERGNATIKGVEISAFNRGIWLAYSSNITISKNNLANNRFSIYLSGSSFNNIYQNTVKNSSYSIYLYGADNNNNVISGNNITANNGNGIWLFGHSCYNLIAQNRIADCLLYGIFIRDNASGNTVSGNNITACVSGVGIKMLFGADKNNIYGNNVTKSAFGITIESSSDNVLRNNSMAENDVNFAVSGYGLAHFMQDVNASNTVDDKPMYYLINEDGLVINSQNYPNMGYLAVINSTNIVVQNLNVASSNNEGILFVNTKDSLIQNVTAENNWHGISVQWSSNNSIIENNLIGNSYAGIYFYCSTNNTLSSNHEVGGDFGFMLQDSNENRITRNEITNADNGIYLNGSSTNNITENNITNNWIGIRLSSSLDNRIYHNSFINNTRQVFAWPSTANILDNGYPFGGNYWSNYNDTDLHRSMYQNETGSDGIGDSPYITDENNVDHYPLMKPYAGPHDIGMKLSVSKRVVPEDYNLTTTINVTIINYGEQTENFNFTFQMETIEEEKVIALASRNSTTFTFTWNTIGYAKGNYTFEATIDIVSGETDISDNTLYSWILITKVGDLGGGLPPEYFSCDNIVDGKDLALFLQCFKGLAPQEAMYLADLGGGLPPQFFNCDGKVDGKDLALFLQCFKGRGPDT